MALPGGPTENALANPRCCRACNRPLIGVDEAVETCHACHVPESRTRLAGQSCRVCDIDDRRMLCSRRLADGWMLLCANHAAVLDDRWIRLTDLQQECA